MKSLLAFGLFALSASASFHCKSPTHPIPLCCAQYKPIPGTKGKPSKPRKRGHPDKPGKPGKPETIAGENCVVAARAPTSDTDEVTFHCPPLRPAVLNGVLPFPLPKEKTAGCCKKMHPAITANIGSDCILMKD